MKFLRLLLSVAVLLAALLAVLVAAAFVPVVQTWVAQLALSREPDLKGTVGYFSAEFGKLEISDLQLEVDGAVLTLPALDASLPITAAARHGTADVRRLVAKGWTLDLSRLNRPAPAAASAAVPAAANSGTGPPGSAEASPAPAAARAFRDLLRDWRLPFDLTLDGAELEGDVLVAAAPGKPPRRVHVVIRGGGLGAGREGSFALDASTEFVDAQYQVNEVSAHGRLVVAMASPRAIRRVGAVADLAATGGALPEDLDLRATLGAAPVADGENFSLRLECGARRVVELAALHSRRTGRLTGSWSVSLRDADLAPWLRGHPLPSGRAVGSGRFDTDPRWSDAQATGTLTITAGRLGVLTPVLDRLGVATLAADFDAVRHGDAIRVNRLDATLAAERPIARGHALQPFAIDLRTGALRPADPRGDVLTLAVQGLPLAWLSGQPGLVLAGGDARGDFVIRPAAGGWSLRPRGPLTAAGVSVQAGGRFLARGLDLTALVSGEIGDQGWELRADPMTIASAGRRLATLTGKAAANPGADQSLLVSGHASADLEALAAAPAVPELGALGGRSASGDFSATLGGSTVVNASVTVIGRDPHRTLTASVEASVDADGAISFLSPIKIASETGASNLSAEGTWTGTEAGPQVQVKLTGETVSLDHLRLLAAPLAAVGFSPRASAAGPPARERRDLRPFWGGCVGSLTAEFDRLNAAGRELKNAGGSLDLDHASLRLERGRAELPNHSVVTAEGSLRFNASDPLPYRLKGSAAVDKIEASSWFPAAAAGEDPLIEGRFSAAGDLTGTGANLTDLAARTREEIRLTSTGGILRLLKTSVAESIPEAATPVKDALGTAGSVVGTIFGHKGSSLESGKNPLSPTTEAVLDFTNQVSEISFDQLTVTAVRHPDGSLRLTELAMISPDVRLTGTGAIGGGPGEPFASRPVSVDFRLGLHGGIAKLAQQGGLLSSRKDDLGYTELAQVLPFGGTVTHPESAAWHDFLVKAALAKPAKGK